MRRMPTAVGAIVLSSVALGFAAPPALADCAFLPPFPAIAPAVPSAREIIVGKVTVDFGAGLSSDPTADFGLRIDHVLRGGASVGQVRRITYMYPNWPWLRSVAPPIPSCTYLLVHKGDVIALAFRALAPDGTTRYNAVGWISGNPDPTLQQVTLAALEQAAALPPTTIAPTNAAVVGVGDSRSLVFFTTALGLSLVLLSRRRRLEATRR